MSSRGHLILIGVGALLVIGSVGGCSGWLPDSLLYQPETLRIKQSGSIYFYNSDSWYALGLGGLGMFGAVLMLANLLLGVIGRMRRAETPPER